VTMVPALAGLGAPYCARRLRHARRLESCTRRPHVVRATLEGLAAQVAVLAGSAADDRGATLVELRVTAA